MALSLQDKYDIIELMAKYCFAVDFHDGEAMTKIFTNDGVFEWYELIRGNEVLRVSAKGTDELRAFGAGTRSLSGTPEAKVVPTGPIRTGRHVATNHVVDGDGTTAFHRCYLGANGVYNDEVVKVDGAWKIKQRKVVTGYA
ncbi:MAG: nuclear transport factor 2 family protein [Dehalococcoidia bacterium]